MGNGKVWLITGCSRGIGKSLAKAALAAGERVAATARRTEDLADLCKAFPTNCIALKLDVCEEADIRAAVAGTMDAFGQIDVLVNNAGYGLQGTVEEVSMPQVRRQMETNFFGLMHLTQEVLPHMRAAKAGCIFNVSSIAGMRGMANLGSYNASKFAVEGLTEALAQEVAPFGIRVSLVEPGPYRTDWAGNSLDRSAALDQLDAGSPYREVNQHTHDIYKERSGTQPGDPDQIASVLLEAASADQIPLHMVFGDVAIRLFRERQEQMSDTSFIDFYPHEKYSL